MFSLFTTKQTSNSQRFGGVHPFKASSDSSQSERGFTLIEVMVSIAIFSVVVVMAITGLVSVIDASARSRARVKLVDNINFIISDMVARMRTGYNFDCGSNGGQKNCPAGKNSLYFTDGKQSGGSLVHYWYDSKSIKFNYGGRSGPLTPATVNVTDLTFRVTGAGSGDGEQTRVVISITADVSSGGATDEFTIQTTVTQRLLYPPT